MKRDSSLQDFTASPTISKQQHISLAQVILFGPHKASYLLGTEGAWREISDIAVPQRIQVLTK